MMGHIPQFNNKQHSLLCPYLTAVAQVALGFMWGKRLCASARERFSQPGWSSPKAFSKYLLLPLPTRALPSSQWGEAGSGAEGLGCKRNNPLLGLQTVWGPCRLQKPGLVGRDRHLCYPELSLARVWKRSPPSVSERAWQPCPGWAGMLWDPERIRRATISIPAMPPCNCISTAAAWPGIKAGSSQARVWNKIAATMGAAGHE